MPQEQVIIPIIMHLQRDLVLQACVNKFADLNKEVKNATENLEKVIDLYKTAVDTEKKTIGLVGSIFAHKTGKIIADVTKETVEADLEQIYQATLAQTPAESCPWPWVKKETRKQFAEDYVHHARVSDIGLQFMKNCSYISEVTGAHDPGSYVDIPDVHFRFLLAEYNRLAVLQREQYPENKPMLLQEDNPAKHESN